VLWKNPVILWSFAGLTAAVTILVILDLTDSPRADEAVMPGIGDVTSNAVARVGDYSLYETDTALIRAGDDAVETWVNDQILACAAEMAGLENPSVSSFVARRARQLYLRDLMMEQIINGVEPPSEAEVMLYMQSDPGIFLIERHYFQIILADGLLADSIYARLVQGQNFQVTARNVSIGQKAGIGGDLGFATGAEMLVHGLPDEIARLEGLSPVIPSSLGWHIFGVFETRALEDSVRALESAGQLLYETRIQTALDSVINATRNELSVEVML